MEEGETRRVLVEAEQLKALTRGKAITAETLRQFVQTLDIPEAAREDLLALTPDNYTGLAEQLTRALPEA